MVAKIRDRLAVAEADLVRIDAALEALPRARTIRPAGRGRARQFAAVDAELAARGYTRMLFDLGRIEVLLDLLGSPQRAYPSIHLTGTNGKTSTARMIDSLLRALGLRTGRYTSPHLETVRERISLDGEPIDEERFVDMYREVAPLADLVDEAVGEPLTYFDMTTALAFAAFADAPVDVAVVEVGLGGAEDATNVLQAGVAVLTPIGLDHTEWLGDTLEDIALHKAGIIHSGATVIAAVQEEEAVRPILERAPRSARPSPGRARVRGAAPGGRRRWPGADAPGPRRRVRRVFLPLHGAHQAQNAALALAAVEAFLGAGAKRQLDIEAVREGFATTSSPGRLERVRNAPTVLLDAAHNPHGMAATVTALQEEFAFSQLVGVLAVLGDKDAAGLLELLEPVSTRSSSPGTPRPGRWPPTSWPSWPVEVFGAGPGAVADEMPDAIEAAVAEAETTFPASCPGWGCWSPGRW